MQQPWRSHIRDGPVTGFNKIYELETNYLHMKIEIGKMKIDAQR